MTPILVVGVGHMGGALVDGWLRTGAFAASDLILNDPKPGHGADTAVAAGAKLNPPDVVLKATKTVLLAVRPQIWREVAAALAPKLAASAPVVSVAAGIKHADLVAAFPGHAVARVMPTTAVAVGKGAVSIFAPDAPARAAAHALFDPVATTVDLGGEALMDAAVAVSGSAPAYLYALIEALAAAGEAEGLAAEDAKALVRATVIGAAALLDETGADPAQLRREVASPGGTTEAALKALLAEDGLGPLMVRTVQAAARRSRELGR